jgi:hypothetical protein
MPGYTVFIHVAGVAHYTHQRVAGHIGGVDESGRKILVGEKKKRRPSF